MNGFSGNSMYNAQRYGPVANQRGQRHNNFAQRNQYYRRYAAVTHNTTRPPPPVRPHYYGSYANFDYATEAEEPGEKDVPDRSDHRVCTDLPNASVDKEKTWQQRGNLSTNTENRGGGTRPPEPDKTNTARHKIMSDNNNLWKGNYGAKTLASSPASSSQVQVEKQQKLASNKNGRSTLGQLKTADAGELGNGQKLTAKTSINADVTRTTKRLLEDVGVDDPFPDKRACHEGDDLSARLTTVVTEVRKTPLNLTLKKVKAADDTVDAAKENESHQANKVDDRISTDPGLDTFITCDDADGKVNKVPDCKPVHTIASAKDSEKSRSRSREPIVKKGQGSDDAKLQTSAKEKKQTPSLKSDGETSSVEDFKTSRSHAGESSAKSGSLSGSTDNLNKKVKAKGKSEGAKSRTSAKDTKEKRRIQNGCDDEDTVLKKTVKPKIGADCTNGDFQAEGRKRTLSGGCEREEPQLKRASKKSEIGVAKSTDKSAKIDGCHRRKTVDATGGESAPKEKNTTLTGSCDSEESRPKITAKSDTEVAGNAKGVDSDDAKSQAPAKKKKQPPSLKSDGETSAVEGLKTSRSHVGKSSGKSEGLSCSTDGLNKKVKAKGECAGLKSRAPAKDTKEKKRAQNDCDGEDTFLKKAVKPKIGADSTNGDVQAEEKKRTLSGECEREDTKEKKRVKNGCNGEDALLKKKSRSRSREPSLKKGNLNNSSDAVTEKGSAKEKDSDDAKSETSGKELKQTPSLKSDGKTKSKDFKTSRSHGGELSAKSGSLSGSAGGLNRKVKTKGESVGLKSHAPAKDTKEKKRIQNGCDGEDTLLKKTVKPKIGADGTNGEFEEAEGRKRTLSGGCERQESQLKKASKKSDIVAAKSVGKSARIDGGHRRKTVDATGGESAPKERKPTLTDCSDGEESRPKISAKKSEIDVKESSPGKPAKFDGRRRKTVDSTGKFSCSENDESRPKKVARKPEIGVKKSPAGGGSAKVDGRRRKTTDSAGKSGAGSDEMEGTARGRCGSEEEAKSQIAAEHGVVEGKRGEDEGGEKFGARIGGSRRKTTDSTGTKVADGGNKTAGRRSMRKRGQSCECRCYESDKPAPPLEKRLTRSKSIDLSSMYFTSFRVTRSKSSFIGLVTHELPQRSRRSSVVRRQEHDANQTPVDPVTEPGNTEVAKTAVSDETKEFRMIEIDFDGQRKSGSYSPRYDTVAETDVSGFCDVTIPQLFKPIADRDPRKKPIESGIIRNGRNKIRFGDYLRRNATAAAEEASKSTVDSVVGGDKGADVGCTNAQTKTIQNILREELVTSKFALSSSESGTNGRDGATKTPREPSGPDEIKMVPYKEKEGTFCKTTTVIAAKNKRGRRRSKAGESDKKWDDPDYVPPTKVCVTPWDAELRNVLMSQPCMDRNMPQLDDDSIASKALPKNESSKHQTTTQPVQATSSTNACPKPQTIGGTSCKAQTDGVKVRSNSVSLKPETVRLVSGLQPQSCSVYAKPEALAANPKLQPQPSGAQLKPQSQPVAAHTKPQSIPGSLKRQLKPIPANPKLRPQPPPTPANLPPRPFNAKPLLESPSFAPQIPKVNTIKPQPTKVDVRPQPIAVPTKLNVDMAAIERLFPANSEKDDCIRLNVSGKMGETTVVYKAQIVQRKYATTSYAENPAEMVAPLNVDSVVAETADCLDVAPPTLPDEVVSSTVTIEIPESSEPVIDLTLEEEAVSKSQSDISSLNDINKLTKQLLAICGGGDDDEEDFNSVSKCGGGEEVGVRETARRAESPLSQVLTEPSPCNTPSGSVPPNSPPIAIEQEPREVAGKTYASMQLDASASAALSRAVGGLKDVQMTYERRSHETTPTVPNNSRNQPCVNQRTNQLSPASPTMESFPSPASSKQTGTCSSLPSPAMERFPSPTFSTLTGTPLSLASPTMERFPSPTFSTLTGTPSSLPLTQPVPPPDLNAPPPTNSVTHNSKQKAPANDSTNPVVVEVGRPIEQILRQMSPVNSQASQRNANASLRVTSTSLSQEASRNPDSAPPNRVAPPPDISVQQLSATFSREQWQNFISVNVKYVLANYFLRNVYTNVDKGWQDKARVPEDVRQTELQHMKCQLQRRFAQLHNELVRYYNKVNAKVGFVNFMKELDRELCRGGHHLHYTTIVYILYNLLLHAYPGRHETLFFGYHGFVIELQQCFDHVVQKNGIPATNAPQYGTLRKLSVSTSGISVVPISTLQQRATEPLPQPAANTDRQPTGFRGHMSGGSISVVPMSVLQEPVTCNSSNGAYAQIQQDSDRARQPPDRRAFPKKTPPPSSSNQNVPSPTDGGQVGRGMTRSQMLQFRHQLSTCVSLGLVPQLLQKPSALGERPTAISSAKPAVITVHHGPARPNDRCENPPAQSQPNRNQTLAAASTRPIQNQNLVAASTRPSQNQNLLTTLTRSSQNQNLLVQPPHMQSAVANAVGELPFPMFSSRLMAAKQSNGCNLIYCHRSPPAYVDLMRAAAINNNAGALLNTQQGNGSTTTRHPPPYNSRDVPNGIQQQRNGRDVLMTPMNQTGAKQGQTNVTDGNGYVGPANYDSYGNWPNRHAPEFSLTHLEYLANRRQSTNSSNARQTVRQKLLQVAGSSHSGRGYGQREQGVIQNVASTLRHVNQNVASTPRHVNQNVASTPQHLVNTNQIMATTSNSANENHNTAGEQNYARPANLPSSGNAATTPSTQEDSLVVLPDFGRRPFAPLTRPEANEETAPPGDICSLEEECDVILPPTLPVDTDEAVDGDDEDVALPKAEVDEDAEEIVSLVTTVEDDFINLETYFNAKQGEKWDDEVEIYWPENCVVAPMMSYVKGEEGGSETTDGEEEPIPRNDSVDSGVVSPLQLQSKLPTVFFEDRTCYCGKHAVYVCMCRAVMYCSSACQVADWHQHSKKHGDHVILLDEDD